MIRRFRGLFIIVRTLLPVLLVVGLAVATWATANAVVATTGEYGDRLAVRLDGVKTAVDEANEGLEAIGGFVTSSVDAADALLQRVADLQERVTISLPRVQIPPIEIPVIDYTIDFPDFRLGPGDLEIPIPGMAALQNLAGDLAAAGRAVTDPVVKVTALADVPPHLEEAAQDTAEYARDVRSVMSTWLVVVLGLLAAAALVWLVAAARPVAAELSRGWSMLAGRPSPERSVGDLAKRVAELERRVAALT